MQNDVYSPSIFYSFVPAIHQRNVGQACHHRHRCMSLDLDETCLEGRTCATQHNL